MVATAITPLAAGDPQRLVDLSMIVAIMVGLFSIVAGLARAGFIASFLSRPILVGYLNGIGLSLLVGQLGKLFGYEAATSGFVAGILALLENLLHIHWPTLILGSLSLLLMVLLRGASRSCPGRSAASSWPASPRRCWAWIATAWNCLARYRPGCRN